MESYTYLLVLALVLLSTKAFGLLTEHIHLPQVVGALIAGIILGPSGFGILESTDFLVKTAQIGVIMLMFTAGIDTDLNELKETGLAATGIALMGVIIPLLLCGGVYYFFFIDSFSYQNVLQAAFVGVIFSATSVSITVETLNEMGKLKSKLGTTLLSAALIDDIIGIVVLSVISGLSGANEKPTVVIGRILLFFVFTFVVGIVVRRLFLIIAEHHWHSRRVAVWSFAFCLIMAYCAEAIFGVADITGAFFAGVILCNVTKARQFVAKKITVTSYMIFAPVFFASVGMKTNIFSMTREIMFFAIILLIFTLLSKVIGCGLMARACRLTKHESLVVGIGMMARGEVALMVAEKGIAAGMIKESILPAIVLSIIVASLATPVLLKVIIPRGPELR